MPSWNPVTGVPSQSTVDEVKDSIDHALLILDDRANLAHKRTLDAYGMLQYFPAELHSKVIEIIDVLTGKADPGLVVQRWQAAIEETADLEQGRIQAQKAQILRDQGFTDVEIMEYLHNGEAVQHSNGDNV
jgi:hypothetical protein